MPISPQILVKVFDFAVKTSKTAFRGKILLRKVDVKRVGNYLVEVTRRTELGADGAISSIVRIFKNNKTEEVWHIVVKAGKTIHKHLLK